MERGQGVGDQHPYEHCRPQKSQSSCCRAAAQEPSKIPPGMDRDTWEAEKQHWVSFRIPVLFYLLIFISKTSINAIGVRTCIWILQLMLLSSTQNLQPTFHPVSLTDSSQSYIGLYSLTFQNTDCFYTHIKYKVPNTGRFTAEIQHWLNGLREGMLSHSRLLGGTGQIFNCTLGKYLINTTLFLIRIGDDVKGVKSPREKSLRKLLKKQFNQ